MRARTLTVRLHSTTTPTTDADDETDDRGDGQGAIVDEDARVATREIATIVEAVSTTAGGKAKEGCSC